MLDACCRQYWSRMFPPEARLQGRINAFDWWVENASGFLRTRPEFSLSRKELEELVARLGQLDAFLQEKHSGFPSLSSLSRLLGQLESGSHDNSGEDAPPATREEKAEKPKVESKKNEQPAAKDFSPVKVATEHASSDGQDTNSDPARMSDDAIYKTAVASQPPVASEDETLQARAQIYALAGGICAWELPRGPNDPYCFAINRLTVWSRVGAEPLHLAGKTELVPVDGSFKELLLDLRAHASWDDLLTRSELMLRSHPYWLDLCRFADESFSALGEQYARARAVCAWFTSAFIQRFPGIEELSYADGSPFADERTKEWLRSLALLHQGGQTPSFEDSLNRSHEQALANVRTGNLPKACEMMEERMRTASSSRERALWRILLARILNEADQTSLARMHFDILLELLDNHKLEEWDEELALAVLCAAYKGMHPLGSESIADIRAMLLQRITRLSPSMAVQLVRA